MTKTPKNEKEYKKTSRKEMEKKRKDENIRGNWCQMDSMNQVLYDSITRGNQKPKVTICGEGECRGSNVEWCGEKIHWNERKERKK